MLSTHPDLILVEFEGPLTTMKQLMSTSWFDIVGSPTYVSDFSTQSWKNIFIMFLIFSCYFDSICYKLYLVVLVLILYLANKHIVYFCCIGILTSLSYVFWVHKWKKLKAVLSVYKSSDVDLEFYTSLICSNKIN